MGKYFNLTKAWRDIKDSAGFVETAGNVAAFAGKAISNTAVYGVTEALPSMVRQQSDRVISQADSKLNDPTLTSEERDKLALVKEKALDNKEKAAQFKEHWK
ncbi:hypothetical protein ACOTEK_02405 [Achromobacter xylosoxidans]